MHVVLDQACHLLEHLVNILVFLRILFNQVSSWLALDISTSRLDRCFHKSVLLVLLFLRWHLLVLRLWLSLVVLLLHNILLRTDSLRLRRLLLKEVLLRRNFDLVMVNCLGRFHGRGDLLGEFKLLISGAPIRTCLRLSLGLLHFEIP